MAQIEVQAPQDNEQRFKVYAQTWLDNNPYTGPRMAGFDDMRKKAFANFNFMGWQWTKDAFFKTVYSEELSYQQFDTILQILNMTTAVQMGMDMDEFRAYHENVTEMSAAFSLAKDDADTMLNKQFAEMEAVVDNTPVAEQVPETGTEVVAESENA